MAKNSEKTEVPWARILMWLILAVVGLSTLYMGLVFVNTAVQGFGFSCLGFFTGSAFEQAIQNHNSNK